MPRLAALILALSLLGCRTQPLDFDGGVPGTVDLAGGGGGSGGSGSHDMARPHDLAATPTSCCGQEGKPGTEFGVGKFCQASTDCASQKANICATTIAPNATFCTMTCMTNGSTTECGSGATCQCAMNQCACVPGECVTPPPGC